MGQDGVEVFQQKDRVVPVSHQGLKTQTGVLGSEFARSLRGKWVVEC